MNTPSSPAPRDVALETRVAQWLQLKHELQTLHAKIEYARLMVRLGLRSTP